MRLSYGSEVSPASSPERQRSFQGSPSVSTIEGPTRLLRIGPVPPSTSPGDVVNLLGPLAAVDQARLTSGHPRYALVAFVDIETAIRVAVNLGGREIFGPEYGTCQGMSKKLSNIRRSR